MVTSSLLDCIKCISKSSIILISISNRLIQKGGTSADREKNKTNYFVKYKKRLLLRCIHYLKSGLICGKDHMRFSGTEPSSMVGHPTQN